MIDMGSMILATAALGGTAGALVHVLANDALTNGQTWTVLGALVVVIGAGGKAAHWIANRFLAQADKRDEKLTGVIERNTEVVGANTTATLRLGEEMRALVATTTSAHQHAAAERDKAVAKVEDAIDEIPQRVVDEMQRRRTTL